MTTNLPAHYALGRWQHPVDGGQVQCDLCPRYCRLHEGQRAFCFVRQNVGGVIYSTSYGRATGFCLDPIEKKPLSHFYPGSAVLSFGTAGCNLGCKFCQNWDISKAREIEALSDAATPEQLAQSALDAGAHAVAFTYNDPVIFAEYAIDAARECRARGVKTVAVTAGYITEAARKDFFETMDAVNVDLKGFTESFYRKLCYAELAPVLDTLRYLARETDVWLEVTTLLIPGHNDSEDEVSRLCDFVARELGVDVPLHFSAFHPDFRMLDVPATPPSTCRRARQQALAAGLRYVYTGNIHDPEGQSTRCPGCSALVIERDGYDTRHYGLQSGACVACGTRIAGRFWQGGLPDAVWGSRRKRLVIARPQ
ncbi:MAG: AmmeMemoRadiSam system radical SAM enzyme [Polyangiaceae bacterium]|nr:AmmeMemoRadiSam system radical SAM enzyme [Polyangiaceae bacterium]